MDKNQPSPADFSQAFYLSRSGIRGRLIRLGPALDAIVKRHHYPDDVAELLGETLALAAGLAAALKYEGIFTLQARGDGPVSLLVTDISSAGAMRAYAQFDPEKLKHAGVKSALLVGKGHLAFTVDTGENAAANRYQGLVDLVGRDMAACVQNYFRQSEQIDSEVVVHIGKGKAGWGGSAILLQRMPEGGGYAANNNAPGGPPANEERLEDWQRTRILLGTLKREEMLDADLPAAKLLHRLFHEEGLELSAARVLSDKCRCSRSKVAMVLSTIPPAELQDLMINNKVEVKCEFCGAVYDFDEAQIKQIEAGPGVR